MDKRQHWYLDGWEYAELLTPGRKRKRKLCYCGEYYRPAVSSQRFVVVKVISLFMTLSVILIYVGYSLCSAAGSRTVYAGACSILAIIPLMFQGMSCISLTTAPLHMTYRAYRAGWKRLLFSTICAAILLGEAALGQGTFMIIHRNAPELVWTDEWKWLLGSFLCAGLDAVVAAILLRTKIDILSNEIVAREATGGPIINKNKT